MHLLISLLVGLWAISIAVLSVQNATAVAVKFLTLQSIALPVGVALTFAFLGGLLVSALLPLLWRLSATPGASVTGEDEEWG